MVNLPNFRNNNKSNNDWQNDNPSNDYSGSIFWEESDDVYKPTRKNISQFLAERGLNDEKLNQKYQVYIKEEALDNLQNHLKSNFKVEQGGILFGNAYEDESIGVYVEITAAVPAPATIGTGAHLEFTSDSWIGIMNGAKAKYPNENIVGWYHSHPKIGVFMSATDMRTQEAFFHHTWSLSIVHDPYRRDTGYFLGKQAQLVQPVIIKKQQKSQPNNPCDTPQNPRLRPSEAEINGRESLIAPQDNTSERYLLQENDTRNRQKRKSNQPLPLVILVIFLGVIFVIIALIPFIDSLLTLGKNSVYQSEISNTNLESSEVAPKSNLSISQAQLSVNEFKDIEQYSKNYPSFSRYRLLGRKEKIGSGNEVSLLLIAPQGTQSIKNVKLEIEKIELQEDFKSSDFYNLLEKRTNNLGNSETLYKEIPLLKSGEGVFFVLYSSYADLNNNLASSLPIQEFNFKRVVRDVIYIPRKLTYKDSNNQLREIEIKDELGDG